VLPWLNLKGQHQGFPVPVPPQPQLSNTSLAICDSYVAISSDLQLAAEVIMLQAVDAVVAVAV